MVTVNQPENLFALLAIFVRNAWRIIAKLELNVYSFYLFIFIYLALQHACKKKITVHAEGVPATNADIHSEKK